MGRIAIVSCPPDMSCYETNEFQNGVKIDRDILHQSSLDQGAVDITCRFVLDIVSEKKSHAPKVVIEGFDDTTLGTLRQLYQAGIRYVQGYIVGMSGTEIYRLDQKQSDYLKHLINNV